MPLYAVVIETNELYFIWPIVSWARTGKNNHDMLVEVYGLFLLPCYLQTFSLNITRLFIAHVQAPKELSEETKQRIQQIFERQAANGRLDLKGFKLIFRLMGQVVSSTEAEQMYEDGDRDDNGTIDLDEFLKLYAKYSQEEEERKAALRESIDKLFPDENLRLKKVEQLLMNVNSTIIREKSDLGTNDIRLLVKSMDTDGNGIISKQELVDTLCKHYEV
ncbi:uncharacterized protein LOC131930601 [Physella acuta]|uniref:uncharacterized protein LOC131930601 n=1 Tax=Physella acuta TaxID=109671 RepID=UPI0027DC2DAE|nr:uncharacterized protein LOC131930601 [Physella acuta]